MSINLHQQDLPRRARSRRRGRGRHRGDGAQPASRPAVPGAAVGGRWRLPPGAASAGRDYRAPQPAAGCSADPAVEKLFHFARFDLGDACGTIWACSVGRSTAPRSRPSWRAPTPTGTASRTCARSCSASSCRSRCRAPTGARPSSAEEQLSYAASDVLHLHASARAPGRACWRARAGSALAAACFAFLPQRAELDLAGWAGQDIFAY